MTNFDSLEDEIAIRDLNRVGEDIAECDYVINLSTEKTIVYGSNHLPIKDNNDLAHFLMMRNRNISMEEAVKVCEVEKPYITVVDVLTGKTAYYDYMVIN